jgi:3-hydroxybutyryl-CoA dehydrogenase
MPIQINTICVLGAGTMGSGIAQVAAQSGFSTLLFDVQPEMLDKAKSGIRKNLDYLLNKQKITAEEKEIIFNRIQFVADINSCIADMVIEAIIEKMDAKLALLSQLAVINHPGVIFATNTSSLSVSAIQKNVSHPQRVVGMHFFNPAPLMKLVEVVKGELTSNEVVQATCSLAKQMGKTAVTCIDSPGFIVNRVARPYYLEAMKLVELGLTTPAAADAAMKAAGFKMGPFELMDLIGMDINYAVSQSVYQQMGEPPRLQPSPLQKEKVEQGKLGRKTGEGFYKYNP